MITDMENNYSRGNYQWPMDMTKAHALLVNWKVDAKRGKEGLDQAELSYLTPTGLDHTAGR